MWLNTFHGVNDVSGLQQDACNLIPGGMNEAEPPLETYNWDTIYSVLNLNVSSMPVKIRFGACLPA